MEHDCWRPPSLPTSTFRNLPTFGGTTYRKPDKRQPEARRKNAYWFSKTRSGGDMLLQHRGLAPVAFRDWGGGAELGRPGSVTI